MSKRKDTPPSTWRASPEWFTSARTLIPWLRSQHVHIVRCGLEEEVADLLGEAAFTCVELDGSTFASSEDLVRESKRALRLWDYCGKGWDSWRDCLSDLNDIWEDTDRLALLWRNSDVLMNAELQSWVTALSILEETSRGLQMRPQLLAGHTLSDDFVPHRLMVFEVFCFVDGYGAQHPVEFTN